MNDIKKRLAKLPAQLRTAVNKFPLKRPDDSVPEFIIERIYGENDEDFSLELNENEQFEVAEWAFKRADKELPDTMEGVSDYTKQIGEFSSIIIGKLFSMHYDSGELKPCELYQKNEKVFAVGIKDRKKLNKKCKNVESELEKGAIYAKLFGIEEEFDNLELFEQKLFYWYCYANDAKNTKVGKN